MSTENAQDNWHAEYTERYYGQKPNLASAGQRWEELIRNNVFKGARVLEVGGGPVDYTTKLLAENAAEVVGLDVDPVVQNNPVLDQAFVYDGGVFPLASGRFDVAVSRWVNEHVPNPELHFREIHRVLAPGGLYIFRTVNQYHYAPLVATCTPHWLQIRIVRLLKHHSGKDHYDAYATFYRANNRRRITALCKEMGFVPVYFKISEFCSYYGKGSKLLFYLFMWYERFVNSSARFEGLRHTIDCVVRRSP